MGKAMLRRRYWFMAVAAVAAVAVGLGAAAQAGVLSRAFANDHSARAAAAAISDTSGNDVVAINETTAADDEEPSATLLRVGDTKVGEAPSGNTDLLGSLLNGQPTEALVDAGCDNGGAPACVALLQTSETHDNIGNNGSSATAAIIFVDGVGGAELLQSRASDTLGCSRGSARVARVFLNNVFIPGPVDSSEQHMDCDF